MKKVLAILLSAMMLFSLTACDLGGLVSQLEQEMAGLESLQAELEEQNDTSSQTQENDISSQSDEVNPPTTVSLPDTLEVYGFSADDFKPEGFKEHSTVNLMGTPGGIQSMLSFLVEVESEPTAEAAKAWYGDLFNKLTELSDTDKVYGDIQGAVELATADAVIDASPSLTEIPAFNCYYPCPIVGKRGYLNIKISYDAQNNAYSVFIWMMNYLR